MPRSTPIFGLTAVFALSIALGACADETPTAATTADAQELAENRRAPAPAAASITDLVIQSASAEDDAEFTLLLDAILYIADTNPESELVAKLFDNDQYTVFAPTDQAFLDLVGAVSSLLDPAVLAADGPFAAIDDLLGAGTIEAVVSYHVTEGRRAANSVVPPTSRQVRTIQTLLEGATFTVAAPGLITAVGNTATITTRNVSASNGIIHIINAVILPVDLGL